ncbi:MAG: hypothetical protein CFE35_20865 [Novosphingobium sp. PASSN1]|nr:MAG: hypothetical protein CFE35_20865 [Novosphingobium sp. PASSN1]
MIVVTFLRLILAALMTRTIFAAAHILGQDLASLGVDHAGFGTALLTVVTVVLIPVADLVGGLAGYCIGICRALGWRQLA